MKKIELTPLADSLPHAVPFVGPEALERKTGTVFKARIGANESTFGPSPMARVAMERAAAETWKYCDPENHDLKEALALHLDVPRNNVVVGEGIDGLQGYLVRLVVGVGDAVVTSLGAYPTFNFHVKGYGGALHTVPYKGDYEDIDALIAKAHEVKAKLLYFANPDNPMGTWRHAKEVAAMVDRLPEGCLLLLDEAYADLAPRGVIPDIPVNTHNVIRMRTFSKAYGLAGARVGYAFGPSHLIQAFDKVRNHFGMTRISQAGALAALADMPYFKQVQTMVADSRDHIARIAADNGLTTVPSATNFVAMDCGRDGDYARGVLAELIKLGIFVRMPAVAPLDRCIRVSCGGEVEMKAFAAALPVALKNAD